MRLERLALVTRRPVRGWAAGERRSRRPGHSVEFCDYRPYGAGDDLRYVDWNVYGRTDRLYVKLFVDDEDMCLHLLVDASASMAWGTPPTPSKLRWAAQMAAALGFVGLVSAERVGIGILREHLAEGWAPARGRARITGLFDFLGALEGGGTTSLGRTLESYANRVRGSGLVVVISDLLDPLGYEHGLNALLERQLEVQVIHVLSPDEMDPALNPMLRGELRLVDEETGEARVLSLDGAALQAYRERMSTFIEDAQAFCNKRSIRYQRVTTDTPVEEVVLGGLGGKLLT